ncbi:MAG: hypothetical protein R3C28_22080 [Pirellulaceae bacterium]
MRIGEALFLAAQPPPVSLENPFFAVFDLPAISAAFSKLGANVLPSQSEAVVRTQAVEFNACAQQRYDNSLKTRRKT